MGTRTACMTSTQRGRGAGRGTANATRTNASASASASASKGTGGGSAARRKEKRTLAVRATQPQPKATAPKRNGKQQQQQLFDVESLLKRRWRAQKHDASRYDVQYLVKWAGYPKSLSTWQPAAELREDLGDDEFDSLVEGVDAKAREASRLKQTRKRDT